MDRLKTKRVARRAQNTEVIREARFLINTPNVDIPKLEGMRDHLSSSNNRLSKVDDDIEEHIPEDELAVKYASAAEYDDEAIGMLARLTCRIEALGQAERDRSILSQTPPVQPNIAGVIRHEPDDIWMC
ncbi:hypothetical protein HPB50_020925 [Hyalomma asiaticum]|uniref:Uncharacterized protein n=1 Tax=Hyalomma asiaticum TaxID=266040 RepID=A0ACB7RQI6_HYAAI|nr:hypothetical protein HPB50_020925 [Hyalomma asiaticum]